MPLTVVFTHLQVRMKDKKQQNQNLPYTGQVFSCCFLLLLPLCCDIMIENGQKRGGGSLKRIFAYLLVLAVFLGMLPSAFSVCAEATMQKDAVLAALFEADISSVRNALDAGVVTVTELTKYYLDRIERYNEQYNCFITICDDAMAVAAEREKQLVQGQGKGVLFGIPVVIKDNMDLAGYHTTNGRKRSDDQIASTNADVVEYLLSEGAVIIGKTNMSTDAQDALRSVSRVAGETRNAYNAGLASGGSSGGSAVATSLNFAVASLGTDTNSSLRIPAALAGCVSMRSTFGLISVDGIKRLNSTRDVAGAITRTVYDQAIMLDVLTQGAYSYTENLNANSLSGMRIGVLEQLSYATGISGLRTDQNIDDEVAATFERALKELESCGAQVVRVTVPKLFTLSNNTFSQKDQASKDALYKAFESTLQEEDISAVVYPTYLSAPIRSGVDEDGINWNKEYQVNINNCRTLSPSAGIPEITVPIGNHSLGAGIGMEIASLKGNEQLLLDIAYSYTSVYDHRKIPTGAPNSYADAYAYTLEELISCHQITKNAIQLVESLQIDLSIRTILESDSEHTDKGVQPSIPAQWIIICFAGAFLLVLSVTVTMQIKKRKKSREKHPVS